jgi:hypothetical protein
MSVASLDQAPSRALPDDGEGELPDALDAFLARLGRRRLLRADEEKALARRIERGDLRSLSSPVRRFVFEFSERPPSSRAC